MRAPWKVYFYFLVIYEVGRAVYGLSLGAPLLALLQLPYALLMVALYGLAFERRIFRQTVWKYAFALGLLVYAQDWLVNPLMYSYLGKTPILAIARIQLFAVPLLPLLPAVFLYAWNREKIWAGGTLAEKKLSGFTRVRACFYAFAFVFLLLQPVFADNAPHFGWGFFPMVASIYMLPLFAAGLFADTCVTTIDCFRRPETSTRWLFRVPLVGAAIFVAYVVVLALMLL